MSNRYNQNIISTCDMLSTPERCEMCERPMTPEDHNFCDICDDCREQTEEY
jgi:hypothetical protein